MEQQVSAVDQRNYDITRIRELALDAVPQSVVVSDALRDGCPMIYVNAAFEKLTGYSADEVMGRSCNLLSGPQTAPYVRQRIRTAVREHAPFHGLVLNYRKDGSQFWNDLTIIPVDDGQNGKFFVGVQIDVTERLQLEDSLRESQKMEALGKLSGGLAHDFNNILALIMGNAEIIAGEAPVGSLLHEAARDIIEAADGGSNVVARLLQFARGQSTASESVNVNALIQSVVALLARTMAKTIHFQTDLSASVGTVIADKTLFETALVNLSLNARDAMPNGGSIRISTRRRADAGPGLENAIVISVTDTGQGMDEETRLRAFEPFFTTKDNDKGTGLGLSMVYRFVRQSGGYAKIESSLGQGTTIELILPSEQAMPVAPDALAEGSNAPRVLIVEDEGKVRKLLAIHLARAGYIVDEAANGEEAMHLVRELHPYDLIVSDIRMGDGMSGIDLVAAVRAERPDMPMLLITAFADELESPPPHISSVPILRKPFRTKELLEAIAQVRG
ncbi:PAS domain S-box-containing protein [Sphingomonas vulcanisoli]|uniref:histidine kinase n=1 Tax=Sphingomonas vulcanisoli TaxID=1658060 RepID=A0ABX0TM82_9SPHN|nr:ATP-binding protein [Sphingomonas vulcanisoli]NIJ06623.1 PAS domain S-box-containing protein [Sphingomonas vulcanisoli]